MNARWRSILFLLLATLSLLIPALINGYPLVYSDTSTYIISGFKLGMPYDRPITYGIFLWLFSLNGATLWTVITVPCLVMAWLILRLVGAFFPDSKPSVYGPLLVLFLSLFTGLSWTACQLMPDIFTPIMFLSTLLLLKGSSTRRERILLFFLYFLSAAMHLSHIAFNVAFLLAVFIVRQLNLLQLKERVKISSLILLLVIGLASILTGGSALSKSRHTFLMGAYVEHGIIKQYLDEYCGANDYQLCAYKDSLPDKAWKFIWDEKSPLQQMGGWKETKEEYNKIIKGTYSSPKYIAIHIRESLKATATQLLRFKIGDGTGVFQEGTQLHERVGLFFPHELFAFENSRQNMGIMVNLPWINRLHQIVVAFSLVVLIFLYAGNKRISANHMIAFLCVLALLGILVNSWTCGTFANAIDRLGCKMIWLVPFMTALALRLSMKLH